MSFSTRAEAFAYMLNYQLTEKKADPMEAAKNANEFADIFAKNMGIPTIVEPPPQGVDKIIKSVDKVMCYCEEHPKAVDYLVGAVTFAAGLFDKVEIYMPEENDYETIQVVTTVRCDPRRGLISKESPFGKQILGKKVGDSFVVEVNEKYSYTAVIRSITKTEDDGSAPLMQY